jgi:hypothetical protein
MDERFEPPWIAIGPELTGDRLSIIADLNVRPRAAKIAIRDHRDSNWNIGCDCYAWVLDAFHSAADGEYADWLVMVSKRGDMDLEFRIGGKEGIRAKLYRPNSPGQPERTLAQANEELRVIQAELGLNTPVVMESVLRFAVDTDGSGLATAVNLVRLTPDGAVVYFWPLWLRDSSVTAIENAPLPEGVVFDDAIVKLHEDTEKEVKRDNSREEGA